MVGYDTMTNKRWYIVTDDDDESALMCVTTDDLLDLVDQFQPVVTVFDETGGIVFDNRHNNRLGLLTALSNQMGE